MYYVYVLKSKKNGQRYTGYSNKKASLRLKEHNSGANDWTRRNGPFELVYTEQFENKKEALRRERYLKTGNGRKFLGRIIPR